MFRTMASLSLTLIITGGLLIAVPADAAIKVSNGVACKKAGQKTKTSLGNYRCSTNPLTTSKKLTWLSTDCLVAANGAKKAASDAVVTSAKFKEQIPLIDFGIATEKVNRAEIQVKLDEAAKRLIEARAKLDAAVLATERLQLTQIVSDWTTATSGYTSLIRSKDLLIRNLEGARATATSKPVELAANVADSRASARLICTKGF